MLNAVLWVKMFMQNHIMFQQLFLIIYHNLTCAAAASDVGSFHQMNKMSGNNIIKLKYNEQYCN